MLLLPLLLLLLLLLPKPRLQPLFGHPIRRRQFPQVVVRQSTEPPVGEVVDSRRGIT